MNENKGNKYFKKLIIKLDIAFLSISLLIALISLMIGKNVKVFLISLALITLLSIPLLRRLRMHSNK